MTEIKQELIAQMDVSEVDSILIDGIDGAVYDEILIKWQLVSDTIVEYDILYAKINGVTSYIDALKFNNDNESSYNSSGGTSFEVMGFYGTTQHNIRGELSIDARLDNAQRIADGYCSYKNLESYMNRNEFFWIWDNISDPIESFEIFSNAESTFSGHIEVIGVYKE